MHCIFKRDKTMSFLCMEHREQYIQHPELALTHWQTFLEKGKQAKIQGEWRSALTCLGSAFDISQLLLNQSRHRLCEKTLDRFVGTGRALIGLYDCTSEHEQAKHLSIALYSYLSECHQCLHEQPAYRSCIRKRMDQVMILLEQYCLIN